jgi:hypothetical protein
MDTSKIAMPRLFDEVSYNAAFCVASPREEIERAGRQRDRQAFESSFQRRSLVRIGAMATPPSRRLVSAVSFRPKGGSIVVLD